MQQPEYEETVMYQKLRLGDRTISPIDWEMTPDLSFGTYESWGGRERVRNNSERIYYFFVDAWGDKPKVCLMERGIKHAKILAEIDAPQDIVQRCVDEQGLAARFERSFAIDETLKQWLIDTVLDGGDNSLVLPIEEEKTEEDMGKALPLFKKNLFSGETCLLPSEPAIILEEDLAGIICGWNFFDSAVNPAGNFENALFRAEDARLVIDAKTSLMWQRSGIDITSIRRMQLHIEEMNKEKFAGFNDWRLPTLEEAMSLMGPVANSKGIHLHPCFSKEQPFIFVAAKRNPGGYWFVDYKHGRAFWSSGTIPGGFGRAVRTMMP
jgi:Protein of unknown function (DUF1566)